MTTYNVDFFSQSVPNLIGGATADQIDKMLNVAGNAPAPKENVDWKHHFGGFYSEYIEPNLLFFIAMFVLGIFLYYKYVMRQEAITSANSSQDGVDEYDNNSVREKTIKNEKNVDLINKILYQDVQHSVQPENNENNEKIVANEIIDQNTDIDFLSEETNNSEFDYNNENKNDIWTMGYGDNYNRTKVLQDMHQMMFGKSM
jgi:hypothetical protein